MNQKVEDAPAALPEKTAHDRQILKDAQARGPAATLGAWVRLSGPGWLQSAITLGGGSLSGALFLGIMGGVSMLWLQLMAIIMGVVMLSAISYVTLSTGERPFHAINKHINPVLGWGWLVATCMANIIWCMPQFALCYEALETNLMPGVLNPPEATATALADSSGAAASAAVLAATPADPAPAKPFPLGKLLISAILLVAAAGVVALNMRGGAAASVFDWLLKGLVGMVVLCFFGVVGYLTFQGELDWGRILLGFIPDFSQWTSPSGKVAELMTTLPEEAQTYWGAKMVASQRSVMIAAAATAVGINMTFLLPYSMLNRGWDKTFRGMARFDLSTGMAIPYILVTTCVVIAASYAFHASPDADFLSTDLATMQKSDIYKGAEGNLIGRVTAGEKPGEAVAFADLSAADQEAVLQQVAALPEAEKRIASSLVKRNAFQLSSALGPLVGDKTANYLFGLGVFGMGFSTIIILMLINGYALCEALGKKEGSGVFFVGCLIAGISGAMWPMIWDGPAKLWLSILASSFGLMLLPIAYITFFMMMNSNTLMGKEKPTGASLILWNILMGISVIGALTAAGTAVYDKMQDKTAGPVVIGVAVVYTILVVVGFFLKPKVEK